jgi:hypothetical protein
MKLTKKTILWIIWIVSVVGLGLCLLYMAINIETEFSYLHTIFYIILLVQFPLIEYSKKRKIERGKKEFGITGDVSLDEIESLRIERDYQEKYAKKWKLKASDQ